MITEERNIADRLYSIIIKRFSNEQPERQLTNNEMSAIWYDLYGRLNRGENEQELENYCNTVELSKPKTKNLHCGY